MLDGFRRKLQVLLVSRVLMGSEPLFLNNGYSRLKLKSGTTYESVFKEHFLCTDKVNTGKI
ncbi:hypothetical protein HanRHA438_Chr01g0023451 [Helianthus annuus]|nr:hypothetical protein HanRHA438_Chr01g0023451 [Helianthus annuus]